jgi:CubicO group peptidase (beta-lactamase class C family)
MLRRILVSAAVAASLPFLSALADQLTVIAPEKVGLSEERLQRLTAALQAEVDAGQMPGAVVAIARKGQAAYLHTFGWIDPVRKTPMALDSIFSIASMTKPMVSVAIMMLHEEGKLQLSDPIGKYLPQLAKMELGSVKTDPAGKATVERAPPKRQPTVQDLLRHTAGFPYGGTRRDHELIKLWPAGSVDSAFTYSGPEFLEKLSQLPLQHEPGTVWDYSVAVDVQGFIVEAVTGKSLSAFLEERIWKPLDMADTGFSVPEAKKARYALAFANDPVSGKPQSIPHASGKPIKFDCGGGCAVSTALDYLRFAQMLVNGGTLDGKRLLSRKTIELMVSDQLGPEVRARTTNPILNEGYSFGLGFAVRSQTGIAPVAGTTGDYNWGGAYGTFFWGDPKEEMAVVYMVAAPGEGRGRLRTLVRNMVLQSIAD